MDNVAQWVLDAKKALAWFIEILGEEEWRARRKKIIDHFNLVEESLINPATNLNSIKKYSPLAMYDDWMGWYMYLVESLIDRPTCDEPAQSARVYPFFAAIGRRIENLKSINGSQEKIKTLLNEKQNQPDSTLFEIVVALTYQRNNWTVEFLKETSEKTPDLKVSKNSENYFVECKRLAKVNKYAETERQEWQKRFQLLSSAMISCDKSVFVDVLFKVPVENTTDDILAISYLNCVSGGNYSSSISLPELDLKVRLIDKKRVESHFSNNYVRQNSPQLIEILTGEYDHHGNYTMVTSPTEIVAFGQDDGLHVLNRYIGGISNAYIAKWTCNAEHSIDKKAKDIKKVLQKAVNQIPDGKPGIIHIGYETVTGPLVETVRYEKMFETIQNFDYRHKNIECIYCHAIQPLVKVGEWECAETTSYFGEKAQSILPEILLLDIPGTETRDTTHWKEDIEKMRQ